MTGLGYTVPAAASVVAVCAWELAVLRTGLFRKPAYWLTLVIVAGFQILVDGWLTKLSAPIVEYAPRQMTGLRGPWDIPVEDFLFGFALVTSALLLWEWQGRRAKRTAPSTDSVPPGGRPDRGQPDSQRPASREDTR
jgi:lycopene cyclase domain-containing protein